LPFPGRAHSLGAMQRITVAIDKEWLSVADICGYMDVSAFVVTNQLRSGDLPAVKFGREWRVARQDFEDWLNTQRERRGDPA
jgi:excisionase family DNA binding protein